jgi:hypothetical protein
MFLNRSRRLDMTPERDDSHIRSKPGRGAGVLREHGPPACQIRGASLAEPAASAYDIAVLRPSRTPATEWRICWVHGSLVGPVDSEEVGDAVLKEDREPCADPAADVDDAARARQLEHQ